MTPPSGIPGGHTGRAAGRSALFAVTLFWGSSFVVVQSGVERMSPLVLVAARFAIAALVLAAIRPRAIAAALRLVPASAPLAALTLAGYTLQSHGLETTTPSRSAFLTALAVVFVPVIVTVARRRPPPWPLWIATGLALAGVWLLFRPIGREWVRGDSLTLASAVAFALFYFELGRLARKHPALELVIAQSLVTAIGAAIAAIGLGATRFELGAGPVLGLLYLGVACTALVFFLMAWGQARVDSTEAAVIYTLEPVLAAVFSLLLGRDPFAWSLVQGGGVILLAMWIAGRE